MCAKGQLLRYLYDLTTSAHWSGADVGILRVERQLGRRARQHLGATLEFCVYDRFSNLVLAVDDALAAELIAGRTQIDFKPPPAPSARDQLRAILTGARKGLRRAVLANATAYYAIQQLRGRSLTRGDVLRTQSEALDETQLQSSTEKASRPIPVTHLSLRRALLDSETLLISGGLDWDFKDISALAGLKGEHRFRYCTIVYDMIPILFPHLVVPHLVPVFAKHFGQLASFADHAMCISEATRRDWTGFCRERGVDMPSYVFPLGSDLPAVEETSPAEFPEELEGKQFALFVSTIEPRKNHRMLYEAWDRCVRSKTVDPARDRLVFVGRQGWAINDLMREISANSATRETLLILNHVPDTLLRALYERSAFVVFPSLYEGYGLPLVEALSAGKPCISSDTGSLPEVGGDLVIRIDPKDTLGWAAAIARYLRSPSELRDWSNRIRAEFRPVTWDQAAAQFFGSLRQMAN